MLSSLEIVTFLLILVRQRRQKHLLSYTTLFMTVSTSQTKHRYAASKTVTNYISHTVQSVYFTIDFVSIMRTICVASYPRHPVWLGQARIEELMALVGHLRIVSLVRKIRTINPCKKETWVEINKKLDIVEQLQICNLRVIIDIERRISQISILLIGGGPYPCNVASSHIYSIWFGYIARLTHWEGGGFTTCSSCYYLPGCRRGRARQDPVSATHPLFKNRTH